VPNKQRALLETPDTEERLQQEFELLDETRRHLAARTVLQDTFRDLQGGDDSQER